MGCEVDMEYYLSLPESTAQMKTLRLNDIIYLSGRMFTARDQAHVKLLTMNKEDMPFEPSGMALYHCGPLMKKTRGHWRAISAGPTTSSRMEPYEAQILSRFTIPLIIGKGGMGQKTADALKKTGAIYAAFPGGAGVLAAEKIQRVVDVYWLEELGMPEAVWVFDVREFGPLVVAMDAKGHSLYAMKQ